MGLCDTLKQLPCTSYFLDGHYTVFFNPQPRRGCLEIREEGGEVFISLLVIFLTVIFLNHIGSQCAICILSILELFII